LAHLENSGFAEQALRFFGTPAAEPMPEPVLTRLAEL
jgi:hypothetical protein